MKTESYLFPWIINFATLLPVQTSWHKSSPQSSTTPWHKLSSHPASNQPPWYRNPPPPKKKAAVILNDYCPIALTLIVKCFERQTQWLGSSRVGRSRGWRCGAQWTIHHWTSPRWRKSSSTPPLPPVNHWPMCSKSTKVSVPRLHHLGWPFLEGKHHGCHQEGPAAATLPECAYKAQLGPQAANDILPFRCGGPASVLHEGVVRQLHWSKQEEATEGDQHSPEDHRLPPALPDGYFHIPLPQQSQEHHQGQFSFRLSPVWYVAHPGGATEALGPKPTGW